MDFAYNNSLFGFYEIVLLLVWAAAIFIYVFCTWKFYEKANQPGWACLIPVYSTLVLLEIVGRPWWYLLLMFVPVVNIVISIMVYIDLAKVFGKDSGFGVGLIFLGFIFIPILALGDAQYQGPISY